MPSMHLLRVTRPIAATVAIGLVLAGAVAGCGGDEPSAVADRAPVASSPAATPHDMEGMEGMDHSGGEQQSPAASTPTGVKSRGIAVDKAFVRQMMPHHVSAVVMARTAVERAEHPELKALAQAIIKTQSEELGVMEAISDDLGVPAAEGIKAKAMAQDAATLGMPMDHMGMDDQTAALEGAPDFDVAFVDAMTEHHQGALAMADAELRHGDDDKLKRLARDIRKAQQAEIAQMAGWKSEWSR